MVKRLMFILLVLCVVILRAQNKTDNYVEQYSQLAIDEMNMYNIPASIILAQAILESGNGESRLAKEGKNHFGIKCHNNWNGETIIEDDDEKGECFRKYSKVNDSYRDHSLFLTERERYSFLFKYDNTQYKKWAKGLKEAGYATNPKYATLLIDLIEKYDLTRFDNNRSGKRNFYFAHSYGLPYVTGLGVYYFKQRTLYSAEINTLFVFSEASIGYHYELLGNFYTGIDAGVIYFPASKSKKFIPQVAGELIYKRNSFLIRAGLQLPLYKIEYKFIPFLKLTYLLS